MGNSDMKIANRLFHRLHVDFRGLFSSNFHYKDYLSSCNSFSDSFFLNVFGIAGQVIRVLSQKSPMTQIHKQ